MNKVGALTISSRQRFTVGTVSLYRARFERRPAPQIIYSGNASVQHAVNAAARVAKKTLYNADSPLSLRRGLQCVGSYNHVLSQDARS